MHSLAYLCWACRALVLERGAYLPASDVVFRGCVQHSSIHGPFNPKFLIPWSSSGVYVEHSYSLYLNGWLDCTRIPFTSTGGSTP